MNPLCNWFGCKGPGFDPDDFLPRSGSLCVRCGEEIPYGDLVGDTRHNRTARRLAYWLFRKWWPEKCTCGKRFAHEETDRCLPF